MYLYPQLSVMEIIPKSIIPSSGLAPVSDFCRSGHIFPDVLPLLGQNAKLTLLCLKYYYFGVSGPVLDLDVLNRGQELQHSACFE